MENLTNEALKRAIEGIGFWQVVIVVILLAGIWFLVKLWWTASVESAAERKTHKNLEVWKTQKDLMFEFVDFLETRIFTSKTSVEEKKKYLADLNEYYAKLYLVFDTPIVKKINELLNNAVAPVQRYYLYREMRIQLLGNLLRKKPTYDDCPYISHNVAKAAIPGTEERKKSFKELKEVYKFIEEGDDSESYKYLPYFE